MKLTIEELRKVYEDGYMQGDADGANTIHPHEAAQAFHDAALLAVARFVAERQRAVEPTMGMYDDFNRALQAHGSEPPFGGFVEAYRAMQSAAPLVVP